MRGKVIQRNLFIFLLFFSVCLSGLSAQRSFSELYSSSARAENIQVFSYDGIKEISPSLETLKLLPRAESNISAAVAELDPVFFLETLRVVPYRGGEPVPVLEIYRAANEISTLKDQAERSVSRQGRRSPVFRESCRIRSASDTTKVPDPPAPSVVPYWDAYYIRINDADFGFSYYRAEFQRTENGLYCAIKNTKRLSVGFISVIQEGDSIIEIYAEPLREGLLVYSVSSVIVPDFVYSLADVPGLAAMRLDVIIEWLVNGTLGGPPR